MAKEVEKSDKKNKHKKEDNSLKVVEEKKNKEKVEEKKEEKTKSKYYFEMWEVIVIMVITALFGLFIGSFIVYKNYNNDKIVCRDADDNVNSITEVYNELLKDYYWDVDKDKLIDSSIKGMVEGLDDPYALYISDENASLVEEELDGSYVGLGIEVINDDNKIKVVTVYDDSPAFKSGIVPGDIIVSIDSVKVTFDNLDELITEIKNSKDGSTKIINILRNDVNIRKSVKLQLIDVKSVFGSLSITNNKRIGVIKISNFASNTYGQFVEEYDALMKDEVEALVIDLRGNGGGYLTSVYSIASMFLDKDDIIYQKTDGKDVEKIINEYEKRIDLPVVLLVNGYTASSAEIFVSSLKDNLNVSIVGTKTYGKGTIQKIQSVGEGKYIKYTTQEWMTPKGRKINGIGITPDVVIPYDDKLTTDVQLNKALDVALNKIGG